jgi:hypothetical protein
MEAHMEIKCKWNSNFELTKERSHRKFIREILAWTMKPPHGLTRKCQKLSQFTSSWTHVSKAAPDESHQQQITA